MVGFPKKTDVTCDLHFQKKLVRTGKSTSCLFSGIVWICAGRKTIEVVAVNEAAGAPPPEGWGE